MLDRAGARTHEDTEMTFPARRTFPGAICVAALALGLAASAQAAPIIPANPAAATGDRAAASDLPVEQVQSRGGRPHGGGPRGGGNQGGGWHHGGGGWHNGGGNWHGGWGGYHRRWYPRYYGGYYGRPYWGRGYYGGSGIYLGLGIPGYSYYDPYYAPAPLYRAPVYRARRIGNAHVTWCYERYRSYRAYDNTYQPYHGPRRQCISPYG